MKLDLKKLREVAEAAVDATDRIYANGKLENEDFERLYRFRDSWLPRTDI